MRLENKVIIITGAVRHVGRAFAVRAAREGASVVVADKDDCSETAEMVAAAGSKRGSHADNRRRSSRGLH